MPFIKQRRVLDWRATGRSSCVTTGRQSRRRLRRLTGRAVDHSGCDRKRTDDPFSTERTVRSLSITTPLERPVAREYETRLRNYLHIKVGRQSATRSFYIKPWAKQDLCIYLLTLSTTCPYDQVLSENEIRCYYA